VAALCCWCTVLRRFLCRLCTVALTGSAGHFTATSVSFQTCWSPVLSPGRTAGDVCSFGMSPLLFRLYMWFFSCPVAGHSLVYLRHPRRPGSGLMRGQSEVCVVRISMFSRCVRLQATLRETQASYRRNKPPKIRCCSIDEVIPCLNRSVQFSDVTSQYSCH